MFVRLYNLKGNFVLIFISSLLLLRKLKKLMKKITEIYV